MMNLSRPRKMLAVTPMSRELGTKCIRCYNVIEGLPITP